MYGVWVASIASVIDETATNIGLTSEHQSRVSSQEGKGF